MNKNIITQFEKLVLHITNELNEAILLNDKEAIQKHSFRVRQISNALKIIKNVKFEITDGNDISNLKGIGKGTIERINIILQTGTLPELKNILIDTQKLNIMNELQSVIGIGPKVAKKYVKSGITSVEDLKNKYNNGLVQITDNKILLGLKYYGKIQYNIPRKEIDEIHKYFKKVVSNMSNSLELFICGSYRRNKETSNDIDVLLLHPKNKNYLSEFVKVLQKDGFIVDVLTDKGVKHHMSFCKYKGKIKRLDIKMLPYDAYHTALLHFTGPMELNTKMRLIAKEKGYLLNEYGLYKGNKKIDIKSEKDIFDILDMKYLEVYER